jgi:hypothetical protein
MRTLSEYQASRTVLADFIAREHVRASFIPAIAFLGKGLDNDNHQNRKAVADLLLAQVREVVGDARRAAASHLDANDQDSMDAHGPLTSDDRGRITRLVNALINEAGEPTSDATHERIARIVEKF